jgi:hypothetical protein
MNRLGLLRIKSLQRYANFVLPRSSNSVDCGYDHESMAWYKESHLPVGNELAKKTKKKKNR